jgi:hypothetical protein
VVLDCTFSIPLVFTQLLQPFRRSPDTLLAVAVYFHVSVR